MSDPNDRTLAFEVEKAKESLETQIEAAIQDYQAQRSKPLEVVVAFEKSREISPNQGDDLLVQSIRQLVDAFHHQDVIVRSGVTIRQVVALDSDGDGQAAVNVKYEYDL